MMLSKWIKEHKGVIARIGTNNGSGFIFAGTVDSFTLNHIEAYTGIKMHDRNIADIYESLYGGVIVLVEGRECGNVICKEDKVEAFDDVPIEYYQAVADTIASAMAQDYYSALIRNRINKRTQDLNSAELDIYQCRQFFLSDQFAILMPHADGREILRLIEEKAEKQFGGSHG